MEGKGRVRHYCTRLRTQPPFWLKYGQEPDSSWSDIDPYSYAARGYFRLTHPPTPSKTHKGTPRNWRPLLGRSKQPNCCAAFSRNSTLPRRRSPGSALSSSSRRHAAHPHSTRLMSMSVALYNELKTVLYESRGISRPTGKTLGGQELPPKKRSRTSTP